MRHRRNTLQQDTENARRVSRLDTWILALALLWAGVGLTLLTEARPAHPEDTQQSVYATAPILPNFPGSFEAGEPLTNAKVA